jgi:RimJ/RimL family protein N-acetyltransferase
MGLADAMIRAARFQDIPAIYDMMIEGHVRSKYREIDAVDPKEAKGFLMNAIQRHGLKREGGTCVFITEDMDGFIVGILDRLYIVGTKLQAQDAFYYARLTAKPQAAFALLAAYLQWAESIPNIAVIRNSVTDIILGDTERVETLYRRCGFARVGVMMEKVVT